MNHYPLHQFFIYNGKVKPNDTFIVSENTGGVYEVIRVTSGVPLFLSEHLKRLNNSAVIAGYKIPFSLEKISEFLRRLIQSNDVHEGNILLSYKAHLKAFFIAHKYPEKEWYVKGVACGILRAERENPNAKVFQTPVRQLADELMQKESLYEVLLVDKKGQIKEGSRSNIFFIAGNQLYTPPGKEVLLGITRLKTIELAALNHISIHEKEIIVEELSLYDAAFITGTSPKILPVSSIGGYCFDPQNEILQQLLEAYDELIRNYIGSNK